MIQESCLAPERGRNPPPSGGGGGQKDSKCRFWCHTIFINRCEFLCFQGFLILIRWTVRPGIPPVFFWLAQYSYLLKGPLRTALLVVIPLATLAETLLCVLHEGLFFRFSLSRWQGIPDRLDSAAHLLAPALVLLVWLGLLNTVP